MRQLSERRGVVKIARWLRLYHSHGGVYGHNPVQIKTLIPASSVNDKGKNSVPNFYRFVTAFREHGHRLAHINPLESNNNKRNSEDVPELREERYSLESLLPSNINGLVHWNKEIENNSQCVVQLLKEIYSNKVGYEFMYIEDEVEREWFAQRIEQLFTFQLAKEERVRIALEMAKSQNFDHFLGKKFQSVKRYGGEGCESMMAFFLELIDSSPACQVDHIILGMAHRGRLNLLTGLLKFPPVRMFQKMKGMPEFPPDAQASGDVLSHLCNYLFIYLFILFCIF
jgi:probable 2-oxoglutarate dehydrogenase E1 component DHKTD1